MRRWAMRRWLRSVVGQTTLVLLAGVVISNLLALFIYSDERRDVVANARAEEIARHVVATAQGLDDTPVAERRRLVWSLRRPGVRLFWSDRPIVNRDDDGWPAGPVRRALHAELGGDAGDRLHIATRPSRTMIAAIEAGDDAEPMGPVHRHPGMWGPFMADAPLLLGALRLDDGSYLNFATKFALNPPLWATPAFSVALATTALVLILALWAVRRAVTPLQWFAHAAERLGSDINAPSLEEGGPIEVQGLARAFNQMQDRLQRLLSDRTLMLAAISHDLRTPITRLRLRAELIEDEDERRKTLSDLDEMQAMLTVTLGFARDDATAETNQRLDLAALLQTVCAEWEDTGADARYAGPTHLGFAGRPLGLKRAFDNLVGNAVRYGVRARVTLHASEGGVGIAVDDDGPGIPEAEHDNVFRPFYRLDASRSRQTGGAGLGLALVRAVIVAHGGRIGLANRPGGGLRVSVFLPSASIPGFPSSPGFPLSTPQQNSNGQAIASPNRVGRAVRRLIGGR